MCKLNKHFQNLLSFVLMLSIWTVSKAQVSYVEFSNEENIDKKAEMCLSLSSQYLKSDLDSLKLISVEMLLVAAEEKNEFAKATGLKTLGSYQIRTGEIPSGIQHLKDAFDYFEAKENYQQMSEIFNDIGHGHYMAGEYNDAIKGYLNSLKYGKSSQDKIDLFNAKNGLSRAYCAIGDTAVGVYTMAEYKNESIKHDKMSAAADAYAYLGQIEMERDNLDLAKDYYAKSIECSKKSESKVHLAHAYNNKAILYFNIGEKDSCLIYFEKSLRLREQLKHAKGVVESYYNIGSYYWEVGDYHNAFLNFVQSAQISKENSFRTDEKDAIVELISICEDLGYLDKLEKYRERLEELNGFIAEKSTSDKDIVEYAEKVIESVRMKEEEEESEDGLSYSYIWISSAGLLIILLLMIFFTRKR